MAATASVAMGWSLIDLSQRGFHVAGDLLHAFAGRAALLIHAIGHVFCLLSNFLHLLARRLLMAQAPINTQLSRRHAWRAPTVCDADGTDSRAQRSHPCWAQGHQHCR